MMKPLCGLFIFLAIGVLFTPQPVQGEEGMVFVPGGSFSAGPPESTQERTVEPFLIDKYEVTQEAYQRVMGNNPSFFKDPHRPVEKVDWFRAEAYCKKVGKRLSTEWEWERAAKAGTQTKFYWGDRSADDYGWYKGNAEKQTHPVGQKQPNALGLYDMAGNVWEWTASDHENGGKVQRGGSWRNGSGSMASALRILSLPHYQYHYVGFRCVRSP